MLTDPPSRQVKSVRNAFCLVNLIQSLGNATPSELIARSDLSKSSVHHYLSTLESMGYVIKEGAGYRLGTRFLTHGIAAKKSMGVQRAVIQTLETVSQEVSSPTWWVAEEFGRGMFLDVSISANQNPIYGSIGKRSYLHTHGLGKAILASLSREYVERIIEYHGLPERTIRTTTDEDALFRDLDEIHNKGYAVSDGETALGIRSVGASFRDRDDRVHAIGIFDDTREITGSHVVDIGQMLMTSAATLEDQLLREED